MCAYSVTALGAAPNSIGTVQLQAGAVTDDKITRNVVKGQPGNPALSASAVMIMAGLAIAFTPAKTGNVRVIITGEIANSGVAHDGASVVAAFGTGVAPVNGAAAAGTLLGNRFDCTSVAGAEKFAFAIVDRVVGLVVGTAYWFDLQFLASTAGNATITDISYYIEEA